MGDLKKPSGKIKMHNPKCLFWMTWGSLVGLLSHYIWAGWLLVVLTLPVLRLSSQQIFFKTDFEILRKFGPKTELVRSIEKAKAIFWVCIVYFFRVFFSKFEREAQPLLLAPSKPNNILDPFLLSSWATSVISRESIPWCLVALDECRCTPGVKSPKVSF